MSFCKYLLYTGRSLYIAKDHQIINAGAAAFSYLFSCVSLNFRRLTRCAHPDSETNEIMIYTKSLISRNRKTLHLNKPQAGAHWFPMSGALQCTASHCCIVAPHYKEPKITNRGAAVTACFFLFSQSIRIATLILANVNFHGFCRTYHWNEPNFRNHAFYCLTLRLFAFL